MVGKSHPTTQNASPAHLSAQRKAKVGDWIWFELLAGRSEAEIVAEFKRYTRELADRLDGETLQAEKP